MDWKSRGCCHRTGPGNNSSMITTSAQVSKRRQELLITRNVGQCPTWWSPSVQRRKVCLTPNTRCHEVTLPRRETSWNFQGCPKLANRSQPLVAEVHHGIKTCRGGMLFNKFFSDCRQVHALVTKIQPDKVVRWFRDGDFFVSCISSKPLAAYFRPAF